MAEQWQALRQEYDRASSSGVPLTDAQRLQFIGQVYRRRDAIAAKLVDLAQRYPDDPVAVEALMKAVWQVNTTPWPVELVGVETSRLKAFTLLNNYLQSEKLGPLCQRLAYGYCREYESFLRAVLAKNPHPDVQGMACLALAQFLGNRLQRVQLCREQPKTAQEFADLFGRDYLNQLFQQDRERALQEIEAFFERALKQYANVKLPNGGTVGDKAAAGLFEIRHLSIGKRAPDIESSDENGQPLKLSDYRGKVVLLDFWSYV